MRAGSEDRVGVATDLAHFHHAVMVEHPMSLAPHFRTSVSNVLPQNGAVQDSSCWCASLDLGDTGRVTAGACCEHTLVSSVVLLECCLPQVRL